MKGWMQGSLVAVVAAVVLSAAVGCQSNKKPPESVSSPAAAPVSPYPAMNQAALDAATGAPTYTAPPASYTPPPQPVVYDPPAATDQPLFEEPVVDASESYAPPAAPTRTAARRTASSGTRYKVKKGESLWSIAQAKYGNGNRWKTIAAANPRINPDRIQAGQTIVLP